MLLFKDGMYSRDFFFSAQRLRLKGQIGNSQWRVEMGAPGVQRRDGTPQPCSSGHLVTARTALHGRLLLSVTLQFTEM